MDDTMFGSIVRFGGVGEKRLHVLCFHSCSLGGDDFDLDGSGLI